MYILQRTSLIWIITLCIALALLTSVYVAYRSMEGEIANQFNRQQEILVKQAASGIEAHIQEILFTLKLGTSLPHDLETLYDRLNGKVIRIVHVDEFGTPRQAYPETTLEQIKTQNYRTADYFMGCWTTGQPYISKWVTDKTQPKRMTVAVPIFDQGQESKLKTENRRGGARSFKSQTSGSELQTETPDPLPFPFKGILMADVDLATIINMYIKPIKSGESGYAWLIDSNGTLLYHPLHPEIAYDKNQDDCVRCHSSFELEAKMITGEAGYTRKKVNPGQEYLIAYSPVHIDGAMWAAIGVNVPYSEVTQSVQKSLICIFILGILTIGIIIGGAAAIIRVNNKRIRAEEKLRWGEQVLEAKKRLQALFDGITDGIAIIDRDYRIIDLNKSFAALSNIVVTKIIGEPCYKQLYCKEQHCSKCPLKLTFDSGTPVFVENSVVEADGSTKDFEFYTYPLKNEKGEAVQAVLYFKDVTRRKELQQRLLESERLVTIGKMAAQVAHEIRNPLSSISLNAELLEEEISSYEKAYKESGDPVRDVPSMQEGKSLLGAIMTEVDRLTGITEDYLKFARLPRPILEDQNVTQILQDLLSFSKEEIAEHGIQVITQLDTSIPKIKADEKQLREAFLNILKNALEAMSQTGDPGRKRELRVTSTKVANTSGAGESVEVTISDTGTGIEEKNLEKVFNPFFTTKETGTGLGLSLTQQIIREHGGTICCKSKAGVGTTFIIRFPVSVSSS